MTTETQTGTMAGVFQSIAESAVKRQGSNEVSKPAKTSLVTVDDADNRREFARTMAHLTALKRTTELTKVQLRAWYAVLGAFPNWIVNRAVIEMAASETRFPEVGDLYRLCRTAAINAGLLKLPYSPHAGTNDNRLTGGEIDSMGQALGLTTKPERKQ